VHDPSTHTFHQKHIVGKAGLFSTADDLLTFMEMLLHRGELNGKRYFSEAMVARMHTEHIPEVYDEMGLGWNVHMHDRVNSLCGKIAFSRSGFTGTQVLCAPERGFAFVFLSNRTYEAPDERDQTAFRAFQREATGIVCQYFT
jgi:CubicO group peptidase (beta-lactamase class C family)